MSNVYCGICHDEISDEAIETEGETEHIVVDGEQSIVHSDCYFAEFGDEVDKHPIGRGTPHGGCHGID